MFRKSLKKQIAKIMVQGYNDRTLELFKDIVDVAREAFREDNEPTRACFLVSHLFRAFEPKDVKLREAIRGAMLSELSQFCDSCSLMRIRPGENPYCTQYKVKLERASYPDIYKCYKCVNWT